MRIVRLSTDGFMRLRAVEITPEGDVITLTGENGAGKSSVLNAIFAAVGGKPAVPGVPIHQGQEEATIELDLGEITVTRRFWDDDKTDVVITAANGARFQRPQQMLDGVIGKISFDPLNGFMRLKPLEQLDMLRKLVTLDVDIDALKGLNEADYEDRTDINREAKQLRARADAIRLPADCPTERRDPSEIADRLQHAMVHNAGIPAKEARRAEAAETIRTAPERIEAVDVAKKHLLDDIDAQIAELNRRRTEIEQQAVDEKAAIKAQAENLAARLAEAGPLPEMINVAEIRAELDSANDHNVLVTQWHAKHDLEQAAEQKEADSARLTAAMAERDRQREEAMKRATFPIDGLAFGDNEVLFGDLPLSQASTGEQIRVAMAIATALNPKLRVICIREASFLSQSGLKLVAEMAAKNDMQVWLEDNRSTDPAAIVIEDGAVKGQVLPDKTKAVEHKVAAAKADAKAATADKAPADVGKPKGEAAPKPPKQAPTKLL